MLFLCAVNPIMINDYTFFINILYLTILSHYITPCNLNVKTNTKNIRDETGRLLTNMELRNRTLKAGKKKEYNLKYFASEKGKKTRSKNMSDYRHKNLKYRLALQMRTRVRQFMNIKNIKQIIL